MNILLFVLLVALGALAYAAFNFFVVKKMDEGSETI